MDTQESQPVTRPTRRYTDAVDEARIIHGAHIRKSTNIPYLSHVLFTSAIVLEYGGTEDQAIAGLLHDAAEDGGGVGRIAAIRAEFGDTVADIVQGLSDSLAEDKSAKAPWLERKQAYLARLADEPTDVLLVSAADKLANLTSIRADYRRLGPELWKRFNAPRAPQLWYTEGSAAGLVDILCARGARAGRMLLCRRSFRRSSSVMWSRSPVGVI